MSEPKSNPRKSLKKEMQLGCIKLFFIGLLSTATLLVISLIAIDKLNLGGKIKTGIREIFGKPPVIEKRVEVEKLVLPPMPSDYVPWQKIDTAKLWNGIKVENQVDAPQGELASLERGKDAPIKVDLKLSFSIPKASQTIDELASVNEHLPKLLPGLEDMVSNSAVSPFYHQLYENKTRRMQEKVTRFDQLLSVHNLYDTQTILELENTETDQKAILVQSDMDVVSDGSDGDRWPFLDNYISMSSSYQPFTSYGWKKTSNNPNPLLKRWKDELRESKERFAVKGLSVDENRRLRSRIEKLEPEIEDLEARSYLIAEADPFIVMSLAFLNRSEDSEYTPLVGDYAAVIYEDKIYPAIFGDYGPSFKMGEASLRIAREISSKASPYNRPVSDLSVTYLVFPKSRDEKKGPPNLKLWHEKCSALLEKIGGLGEGYSLHEWEDIIPIKLEQWRKENDPDYGKEDEPEEEALASEEDEATEEDPESKEEPGE